MHIIIITIFFIFLLLIFSGVSIISYILKALFGKGKSSSNRTQSQRNETKSTTSTPSKQEKIFTDDEGEYIEFEEIKD
ncbi:CHASE3 domain sensor protein [Dysgonomonadaceae bacterium PH5-43]|nr:CHASE3 domain sensor protein [Dysgonomonadaceae bacterium PH5-43]